MRTEGGGVVIAVNFDKCAMHIYRNCICIIAMKKIKTNLMLLSSRVKFFRVVSCIWNSKVHLLYV